MTKIESAVKTLFGSDVVNTLLITILVFSFGWYNTPTPEEKLASNIEAGHKLALKNGIQLIDSEVVLTSYDQDKLRSIGYYAESIGYSCSWEYNWKINCTK